MKKTNKNTSAGMALGICFGVSIGTSIGSSLGKIAMGSSKEDVVYLDEDGMLEQAYDKENGKWKK